MAKCIKNRGLRVESGAGRRHTGGNGSVEKYGGKG